jgi:hypothetical protein
MTAFAHISQTAELVPPFPTTPSILPQLDELIKRRNDTLVQCPEKSADSTGDWLAINFLFSIGCENLGSQALKQLNHILREWMSPSPLSLRQFASMLQGLRGLIAQGL